MFKKNGIVVGLILIILFGFISPSYASANNIIRVEGKGKVNIRPDICYINFSSISENEDQGKAVEENAKKMKELMTSLNEFGIKNENMETLSVYVSPVYNYENSKREIKTYRANTSIKVKLIDLTSIGKIINLAVKNGADRVGSLEYTSSKADQAYNQTFELAARNAEKKADAIAKAFGVEIKGPVKIEETSRGFGSGNIDEIEIEEEAIKNGGDVEIPIHIEDLEILGSLIVEYSY